MELGIFSRTYEIDDLRETYRRMKAAGICRTQLNFSNAGLPTMAESYRDEDIARIRRISEEEDIALDAVSGTFNMIDPDEEVRARGCREFRTQCQAAAALSIPLVSLCTGSKHPKSKWTWHDDNLKDSAWDDLMRTTERILRYAEEYNVILGVETEASNIICTPAKARKYLDAFASPHLKIIMDGANLFRPEQVKDMRAVLDEAFDLLGADIVSAHAKDLSLDGTVSFVAAGEGVLDVHYYLSLLKRSGYNGTLIMHGLSEQQVPKSKAFLDHILQSL